MRQRPRQQVVALLGAMVRLARKKGIVDQRYAEPRQVVAVEVDRGRVDAQLGVEARAEEVEFMRSWQVWDVRPVSEAWAATGKKPTGGRWGCRDSCRRSEEANHGSMTCNILI